MKPCGLLHLNMPRPSGITCPSPRQCRRPWWFIVCLSRAVIPLLRFNVFLAHLPVQLVGQWVLINSWFKTVTYFTVYSDGSKTSSTSVPHLQQSGAVWLDRLGRLAILCLSNWASRLIYGMPVRVWIGWLVADYRELWLNIFDVQQSRMNILCRINTNVYRRGWLLRYSASHGWMLRGLAE